MTIATRGLLSSPLEVATRRVTGVPNVSSLPRRDPVQRNEAAIVRLLLEAFDVDASGRPQGLLIGVTALSVADRTPGIACIRSSSWSTSGASWFRRARVRRIDRHEQDGLTLESG